MVDFSARCAAAVTATGRSAESVIDSGAQNVIVIADAGTVVCRFPRYEPGRINEIAQRHADAAALGLPAPGVVDVRAGGAGTAHIVLTRLPGTPLQQMLPAMTSRARRASARATAELLARLREVHPEQWAFPGSGWAQMWQRLADRAGADPRVRVPDAELARTAAAAAERAPLGLVHGDLAWGNLLFGEDGELTGILDWDYAVIGDPAVDVAAWLLNVPSDMADEFHHHHPCAADDVARFQAYLDTWPLQHQLWEATSPQPEGSRAPAQRS